jgi:hypothetical protein
MLASCDHVVITSDVSCHLMPNAQADDLGVPATRMARGGGLELLARRCRLVPLDPQKGG